MVSYSFTTDWNFYRAAFNRYNRQKPNRYRNIVVATVLFLILLPAWAYGRSSGAIWTPIPEIALVGGVSGGAAALFVAKIMVPRRIKRSPGYGVTVTVRLDDEGLHTTEPHGHSSLDWAAFTRVARFPDGFVFARGRVIRWLADSALTNGTPEEALEFVRSKTKVVVIS